MFQFAFCCCGKHRGQKHLGEGKAYVPYNLTVYFQGNSRQKLKTRFEAETMQEQLLACCPGLLSYLSYIAQVHLLGVSTAHGELGLPTSISNQENALQRCPQ